jgi:hypothetical protein
MNEASNAPRNARIALWLGIVSVSLLVVSLLPLPIPYVLYVPFVLSPVVAIAALVHGLMSMRRPSSIQRRTMAVGAMLLAVTVLLAITFIIWIGLSFD